MLATNVFSLESIYSELTHLLSSTTTTAQQATSSKRDERRIKKIEHYVASHNDEQRGEVYRQSIQSRITHIKRDLVTMCTIKAQVDTLFDIYEHLEETMETFVEAAPLLYDKHIKYEVSLLQESRVSATTPIMALLCDKSKCANDRMMIDVAIQHLRQSYDENCKLLIKLRKSLCDEMMGMYMAFRLLRVYAHPHRHQCDEKSPFSCSFEQTYCVFVMRYGNCRLLCDNEASSDETLMRLIFDWYRRVIFSGVVLLDKKTLEKAFIAIDRLAL
jgi:hypothetical protein